MTGLSFFKVSLLRPPTTWSCYPAARVNPAAWSHLLCPTGQTRRGGPRG